MVDAAAGRVGIVKPQVSFFERYGSAGFAALEDVLAAARAAGLIVIADAKRGDIGTTMDAYAEAWLTPGSPLEADAMTVNPFLGVGTLEGTFELAEDAGKGVFVLAATSNPEAFTAQRATLDGGRTVSASHRRGGLGAQRRGRPPDGVVGQHRVRDRRDRGLVGRRPRRRVAPPRADPRPRASATRAPGPRDLRARFGASRAAGDRIGEPQPAVGGSRRVSPRRSSRAFRSTGASNG